jgi:hypothetical protein
MRRSVSVGLGAACLILGTSCAAILHEAVQRDMYENAKNQPGEAKAQQAEPLKKEEETPWVCPPGKIQTEDCRLMPCKVTCEDPQEPKR